MLKGSWRTSSLGILAIISAICGAATAILDGNPATNPDWTTIVSAVTAGVGLMTARDANVSSEAQGLK